MSSSRSSDVSMTSSIESFFDKGLVHPFRFEPDADNTDANDTTNNTQKQAQQPVKVSRHVVVRTYSRM